jgi:hypothetical protein
MSISESNSIPQQSVPLSCDKIVYRAVKNSWYMEDTKELLFNAFLLRDNLDKENKPPEVKLSLAFEEGKCYELYKKSQRVALITVEQIQNIGKHEGLDLSVELNPNKPDHPQIVGLPCPIKDKDRARRVGSLLAEQCKIIDRQSE